MAILMTLKYVPNNKTWVAQITGKSRKFGMKREFVVSMDKVPRSEGEAEYLLCGDGIYEVCEKGVRRYVKAKGKTVTELTREEFGEEFENLLKVQAARRARVQKRKRKRLEAMDLAMDQRIARINNEGGIGPSEN